MNASLGGNLLSIVVPVYNEADVLPELYRRLQAVRDGLADIDVELVFVNDGSRDDSGLVIRELADADDSVGVVELSRNFGKDVALTAGLDFAKGDAVVVMDADLQDPPELISDMVAKWRQGFDVVYGQRISREGETFFKKGTAFVFYRLVNALSKVELPIDTGDFRLISRRVLDSVSQCRERHRYLKGLFTWVGYRQTALPYTRVPRLSGKTKYSYLKLWNFALEGITSFSLLPLKAATYAGVFVAFLALAYLVTVIVKTLLFGDPVRGWPSLMVVILFLGGVQLICLGVIGEYLGRVFNEVKKRPLYLIDAHKPSHFQKPSERIEE